MVGGDPAAVERRLVAGQMACPGCSAVLVGWGRARLRSVRSAGTLVKIQPRRARCSGCRVTHVLLPATLLVRRADTAVVIGWALAARALGWGHRRIASALGRPAATVRGWLRRFLSRAEAVRDWFTVLLRALAADPVVPGPTGTEAADVLTVILAAARAATRRFLLTVPPWRWVAAVSGGRFLAPGWPPGSINTS